MQITSIVIALAIAVGTSSPSQAGLLDSIKGLFHDCKGFCEAGKIKCAETDPNKKGGLEYCKKKCLGSDKKNEDSANYKAGIATCGAPEAASGMSSDAPAAAAAE